MAKAQIFINDEEIDLDDKTFIALTSQINDLSELKDHQSNYSNTIKVPATKRNVSILENSEQVQSASYLPYKKNKVRVVKDGVDVVQNGMAIISSFNKSFSILIYEGSIDFFSLIDSKILSDINLSDFDHVWNMASIVGSFPSTSLDGWKYPIIDYGDYLTYNSRFVSVRDLRPAVFIKTLFERIALAQGFKFVGDFLDNDTFNKVLLPYNNEISKRSKRWIEARKFSVNLSSFTFFAGVTAQGYAAGTVDKNYDNANLFVIDPTWVDINVNPPLSYLLIPESMWWDVKAVVTYTITGWVNGLSSCEIYIDNGTLGHYQHTNVQGNGTFTIVYNDTSQIANILVTPDITLQFELINCQINVVSGVLSGQPNELGVYYGKSTINIDLSDLNQKDFIKAVSQMYQLFFKTDKLTKEITIKQFKDIVENIPNALDWTNKLHNGNNDTIEYRIGDYAQNNIAEYKKDDTDKEIKLGLGNGFINVGDESLDKTKTKITLPFAASFTKETLIGLSAVSINQLNADTGNRDVKTEQRLVIDDTQTISGGDIKFDDAVVTPILTSSDIPLTYFYLPSKAFNLGFDNSLLQDNYTEFTKVLNSTKKVTAQMRISAVDFYSLDHFTPVYLSQFAAYFYVNKIINWTGDGLCKVELIKIGERNKGLLGLRQRCKFVSVNHYGQINRQWDDGTHQFTLRKMLINGIDYATNQTLNIIAPDDLQVGIGVDGLLHVQNLSDWLNTILPSGFEMLDNCLVFDYPIDSTFEIEIDYNDQANGFYYGVYKYNNYGFFIPLETVPTATYICEAL